VTLYWDPWDPAYGAAVDRDGPGETSTAEVVTDIERPDEAWGPIPAPGDVRAPGAVLFVDGVLRNEARGWYTDAGGVSHPTLAASYAAGVVTCDLRNASSAVTTARVERAVLSSAEGLATLGTAPARYVAHLVRGSGEHKQLDAWLRKLMSELEILVSTHARSSTVDDSDLLVLDGRLRGRRALPRTVGYVKTHSSSYLPSALTTVVTSLPPGHRTPVFRLASIYSWYLRLPGATRSPWAGIVRIECSADLTVEEAVALADQCTATLPRFAPHAYKDPRAPQNLLPIAGLERRLRGMLGDPKLLHRTLQRVST
jgi:hypothetical protein